MKTVKLGTVGSGMIVHMILDAAARTEGVVLSAVYSRSEEKGRSLAEKYGAARVHTNWDSFLEDPEVEAVYIASPNSLHVAQVRGALLAGKHVICEKPFCTDHAQARELAALARERNLMLLDATPTAYLPNLEVMRENLSAIGPVRLVLANYSQYSSRYPALLAGEMPNIFNPAFGGGCLMDINYYNLYTAVNLFGKPRKAVYYPNLYQNKVDTSGVLVLEYEGFLCQCAGAKDTWGENFFQIEGEQGYIRARGSTNMLPEVDVVTRKDRQSFNRQPEGSAWFYGVRRMIRLLQSEDREAIFRYQDVMLDVMEVLEQARKGAGLTFPWEENRP